MSGIIKTFTGVRNLWVLYQALSPTFLQSYLVVGRVNELQECLAVYVTSDDRTRLT